MERGRGRVRGRGQGRKTTIFTLGSSVAARVLVDTEEPQIMTGSEKEMDVTRNPSSSEVAQRLSLSETPLITVNIKDTETKMKENKIAGIPNLETKTDKDEEKIVENEEQEQWINMYRNNKVAQNCMNLTYIPPQIIDGHTIVQLEEEEVKSEEEKWKCALIVYVVGECQGYDTMNRYINLN